MSESDTKRLEKSRADRMVDGVCGGLAAYFGVDPTLVRIAFVIAACAGGIGIVLYIAAMILMPAPSGDGQPVVHASSNGLNHKFWGILLVAVGTVMLLGNFGVHWFGWWWGISWQIVLAVFLILVGVGFIFGGRNYLTSTPPPEHANEPQPEPAGTTVRRLFKSRNDRKIFGVCGGLAHHFGIDPTIVRLLFVISAFVSIGFTLLAYAIMAIVVPTAPREAVSL